MISSVSSKHCNSPPSDYSLVLCVYPERHMERQSLEYAAMFLGNTKFFSYRLWITVLEITYLWKCFRSGFMGLASGFKSPLIHTNDIFVNYVKNQRETKDKIGDTKTGPNIRF